MISIIKLEPQKLLNWDALQSGVYLIVQNWRVQVFDILSFNSSLLAMHNTKSNYISSPKITLNCKPFKRYGYYMGFNIEINYLILLHCSGAICQFYLANSLMVENHNLYSHQLAKSIKQTLLCSYGVYFLKMQ